MQMSECIFCRIVKKEIPADIVFENDHILAFSDIHPQSPVHILVIPKKHVARLMDLSEEDMPVIHEVHKAVQVLARQRDVHQSGFRVVVNNGANAGQAVDHIHYHLLAGRQFSWPPG